MPRPSFEPWDPTTPTPPTHLHRSHDGNLISRTEIQEDLPQEEEGDLRPTHPGHPQAEEAEVAEVAEEAEVAEGAEEHFHCQDKPPSKLRNF